MGSASAPPGAEAGGGATHPSEGAITEPEVAASTRTGPDRKKVHSNPSHPNAGQDPLLVGGGTAWSKFLERLGKGASSGATLLLTGEHGVGKGYLARWVHAHSPRAGAPLVELDLSTGSPNLLESQLFGHEKGAFTGAQGDRLGAARRAHGGTLLLRGVHELALELQVKLLRLLQERVVEPLGSEESIPVDVRVIGTASEDLLSRVKNGSFREDLYYRLAVVVLEVPPLRVRFDEAARWLPGLAERAAQRVGRAPRDLEPESLARLAEYPWPGNVRQLENSLERALVLGGAKADPGPLRPDEFDFLEESGRTADSLKDLARQGLARGAQIDEWMAALLEEAYAEHRGSMAAAARAVGISRKAFEYRLQKSRAEAEAKAAEALEGSAQNAPGERP